MQAFTVEDRMYRSVRAWPILNENSRQYLVPELGHEVTVDGVAFDTAPVKNGAVFSLLGLSFVDKTREAGLHDATDWMSALSALEFVYIRLGDQVIRHRLDITYKREDKDGYHLLDIMERVVINLTSASTDKDGSKLTQIDAFTAAGIQIELTIDIGSRINLSLGDTCAGGALAFIRSTFPSHPSLADHDIRSAIHADIEKLEKKIEILGFTINIERRNWLNQNHRPMSNTHHRPEAVTIDTAAKSLAARYTNVS